MRRPAIRSTAHDPTLSYPTYQPGLSASYPRCQPPDFCYQLCTPKGVHNKVFVFMWLKVLHGYNFSYLLRITGSTSSSILGNIDLYGVYWRPSIGFYYFRKQTLLLKITTKDRASERSVLEIKFFFSEACSDWQQISYQKSVLLSLCHGESTVPHKALLIRCVLIIRRNLAMCGYLSVCNVNCFSLQ